MLHNRKLLSDANNEKNRTTHDLNVMFQSTSNRTDRLKRHTQGGRCMQIKVCCFMQAVYSNEEQVQASHSRARECRLMRSGVKGYGCVIVRHASLCSAAFDPDITDGEMWESESV